MSKEVYNITCPKCSAVQDVELYSFIDGNLDSEKKEQLMYNKLNRVTCSDCGFDLRIDCPLTYQDKKNNILIFWMPETKDINIEKILEDFDELIAFHLPKNEVSNIRLVTTRVELIELIYMIESKINHRVVEYIKYSIFERNPEKLNPLVNKLLLNIEDSTEDELCFVIQNIETYELGEVLRYGRNAYQSLEQLFNEDPEEFLLMFPGPYICARYFINSER